MNLHLLRVFHAVVEHGGFSRAAVQLHVSQPAVSKAVRELEHQLGLPLLERMAPSPGRARGVRATEAGQSLHAHARGIFAMERAAIDDIHARIGLMRGRLALGASTTIAGYWLPMPLARFIAAAAAIEPQVTVGNTRLVADALLDCRVDLGLVEGPVDDPAIVVTPWRNEPLRIIAPMQMRLPKRGAIATDVLNAQPWLVREHGSGTREVSQRLFDALGIVPARSIEFGSNEAIARGVAAGAGLALLPSVVVEDLLALGRVRALKTATAADFTRPLFLLELRDRPRSPALAAFLRTLDAG